MQPEAVAKIADACAKAMKNPLATKRLLGDTAQPVGDKPTQHAAFIKTEKVRRKLVKACAKIKPN